MTLNQPDQCRNVRGLVIQCRQIAVLLAARRQENLLILDSDFLQRFQTIGSETGADHIDLFNPRPCPIRQHHAGIRLQPFGAAKAGLEGDRPLPGWESQPFGNPPGGFKALAMIGIAGQQIAPRQAVEGKQQPVAGLLTPPGADAGGQGVQIAGIVVIMSDHAQFRQPAPTAQFRSDRIER